MEKFFFVPILENSGVFVVYLSKKFVNICKTNQLNNMIENLQTASNWALDNWVIIALVVSEVAALLPAKAKGIIHAIIKVGNSLFQKRSGTIKNS